MRVLLLGARGMLGRDLAALAPAEVALLGAELPRVDITDAAAVSGTLDALRPDVVLNAAAFTRVDDAERDAATAMAVNADAVAALGATCARRGVRVVHLSTDYVFDGQGTRPYGEHDATRPVNRYGESKLRGEQALLASGAHALVVRTQWLFGLHGRSFPRTMWARARAGERTRVVRDQVGRPTYTRDLAAAIWRLVKLEADGVVHAANAGTASWYDVARAVFETAGCADLLTPCGSDEFPTVAPRPAYSVLSTARLERLLGGALPSWEDALARFLDQLRAEETATAAK